MLRVFSVALRVDLDFQPGRILQGYVRGIAGQSSVFSSPVTQIPADENVFADREFVKQHGFLVKWR